MPNKRNALRLTAAELRRQSRKFLAGLEELTPELDFILTAEGEEPGPGPWLLDRPLNHKGRPLGRLRAAVREGLSPGENWLDQLEAAIPRELELARLRQALRIDRETGLHNRDHFQRGLVRTIRRKRPDGLARNLSMDGEAAPELMLVMVELRETPEPAAALSAMAGLLSDRLPLKGLSRVGTRRLGFWLESRPEELRPALENVLDEQLARDPGSRPAAAWARYPQDLGEDLGREAPAGDRPRLLAELMEERVRTALFRARQGREASVVAFGDLLESHGQVLQVLPLDRVIINLGRSAGAAVGQVFLVGSPAEAGDGERECKGEVAIFETADGYSIARISALKSARRIVAGDRLRFSRLADAKTGPGAETSPAPAGILAGLPDRENFLAGLDRVGNGPLALILARLDDYEKKLSVLGREEVDRLSAFVFEKVLAAFPPTDLKTLWRPDILALAWPGGARDELGPAAHLAAAELKETGPVSFGLVFSPGRAQAAESLVADGRKALHEADFSGYGQVAVFGPLALNISGDRLFEEGDLSGAIREYERGLSLAPDHLNLLNSLGVCRGRLGDSNQAREIFERLIELDPKNMMAHYNLGYTHLLTGRLLEAEESLARAAALAPDNFESLFHLGKTALELGHLDRALTALRRAASLGDSRPVVFRLLGEALMLAHDNQGALAAFKKAVKVSPNDAYALSALGTLFAELANDLEVARSLCQKSVEIDPTNCLYRQRLGRLLFNLGDYSGAEHHLTMAMEYGSRAPEVHFQLGRVAEETGRPAEALNHFREALKQDPAFQPALERVGEAEDQAGDER